MARVLVFSLLVGLLGAGAAATDICGVCSCGSGDVLDCKGLSLEGHFNETDWNETQQASSAKKALFDNNDVVHLLPFPALPIVRLSLSHNRILVIEDMAFRDLQDLEELDLSHNHLTSETLRPDAFKGRFANDFYEPLKSLKTLWLGSNALHTLHANLFEHLPMLERLSLESNPLTVLDRPTVMAIVTPAYLKFLDLSFTGLSGDIPDRMLHTPKHLEELNLAGNRFAHVPKGLEDAVNLRKLVFNSNPVKVLATHRTFPLLPELRVLAISRMPNLTTIEAGALGTMPKLAEFYCTDNVQLTDIDPAAFTRVDSDGEATLWPSVKKFVVSRNRLGYLDNSLLIDWESMDEIDLQDNPWVCDCDNQWLVAKLAKIIEANHPENMKNFVCAEPVEMRRETIAGLEARAYHMRCLDAYGNRPEKDGSVLIGVLIGSLVAIPMTMGIVYAWMRFGRRLFPGRGPADYNRTFYSRTDYNDDL